jgi:Fic family protein
MEIAPKYIRGSGNISLLLEIEKSGLLKDIQDNYWYWDKIKYKHSKYKPEELWDTIKLNRMLNSNNINFGNHKFTYILTDYIQKTLHQFDMHIGGNLGSNISIAETDKTKFMISSIMEEAISSSQMEGANTTRKKAKEMILQDKKPKNVSEQMIMNNFITMKYIVQNKHEDITLEKILYIHKLISNNTLENTEDEGKFRDNDEVFVVDYIKSEIIHTPPLKKELELLLNDLCLFFNTNTKTFIHPIIKGCIIHFMTGWIHPFIDGNGRTARALFYWYMLKNGYWLTEYLSISKIIKDTKIQYENAYLYSEKDDNDLGYFITYHLKTMEKAFEALKDYIGKKQKEVFQAAAFLKIPYVNERMAQIIKLLNDDGDRILNSKEIEKRFNISNYTARADLKTLVELGFLEKIQVNKKKQNFIKSSSFNVTLKKHKV